MTDTGLPSDAQKLLTIRTAHRPATDLGFLLHEHPEHVHTREGLSQAVARRVNPAQAALDGLVPPVNGIQHPRFDMMCRGKPYRMPANDFAIPRMEAGKQRAIQSMEEARDWETPLHR